MSRSGRVVGQARDERILLSPQEASHVVIICNNRFYDLSVVDTAGNVAKVEDIEGVLHSIIVSELAASTPGPQVGVLTTDDRDSWCASAVLLAKYAENRAVLSRLRSAAFVVCLDMNHPRTYLDVFAQVLHGGGGGDKGNSDVLPLSATEGAYGLTGVRCSSNRWFDKMQVIVARNGRGGVLLEHSPYEAAVPMKIIDTAVTDPTFSKPSEQHVTPLLRPLPWKCDQAILSNIERSRDKSNKLAASVKVRAFVFRGFGRDSIKAWKASPDATTQIALQLVFYRLHGKIPPTYESAHLRLFHHGRTEVVRTASEASAAFVTNMDSSLMRWADKACLLRNAIANHSHLTRQAMAGEGIDRHMLGLQKAAAELGLSVHPLFKDKGHTYSTHFLLSTSTVSMPSQNFPGFAPLVEYGYGVSYHFKPDAIYAAVTNFVNDLGTDCHMLSDRLDQSLADVGSLLVMNSKL
jgi:hypothetical protein